MTAKIKKGTPTSCLFLVDSKVLAILLKEFYIKTYVGVWPINCSILDKECHEELVWGVNVGKVYT